MKMEYYIDSAIVPTTTIRYAPKKWKVSRL